MSEASEVLAELQATVGLAKADRRADAWRWLDDIDRLASRLEAVLPVSTSELVAAAVDKAEAEHEWVVLGDGILGYRAACPCGWKSTDYATYVSAASAGRLHSLRAGNGTA